MKIKRGTIYQMKIPFVEAFAHGSQARAFSDAIIVRLETVDGVSGFGEGLARRYVTGETAETSIDYIKKKIFPAFAGTEVGAPPSTAEPLGFLTALTAAMPGVNSGGVVWNAARAAFEIALIECYLKTENLSLGDVLPPKRDFVQYSGVIPVGTVEKTVKYAKRYQLFGINRLKIKIDGRDDVERISAVRRQLGENISLRLDANGVYSVDGALKMIEQLEPFKIDAVEQPIPRGKIGELARIRERSAIPIMADESLLTLEDAQNLIEARACDYFNLRLSKCGGLTASLKLAQAAKNSGIKIQIGCQVGETAILSAAGRHFAAHLEEAAFVEGSYGEMLLSKDVSRQSVNFGYRGLAPALRGKGLGIIICQEVIEQFAVTRDNLEI